MLHHHFIPRDDLAKGFAGGGPVDYNDANGQIAIPAHANQTLKRGQVVNPKHWMTGLRNCSGKPAPAKASGELA